MRTPYYILLAGCLVCLVCLVQALPQPHEDGEGEDQEGEDQEGEDQEGGDDLVGGKADYVYNTPIFF